MTIARHCGRWTPQPRWCHNHSWRDRRASDRCRFRRSRLRQRRCVRPRLRWQSRPAVPVNSRRPPRNYWRYEPLLRRHTRSPQRHRPSNRHLRHPGTSAPSVSRASSLRPRRRRCCPRLRSSRRHACHARTHPSGRHWWGCHHRPSIGRHAHRRRSVPCWTRY